jgi:hypothetical protein
VRKATKRIGGAVIAVAAVLGGAVFLHSVRDRQMREADQVRGIGAVAVSAAQSAKPSAPVAASGAPDSIPPAPLAGVSGGVAGAAVALAPASLGDPSPQDMNAAASPPAIASPRDPREMLLDTRVAIHSRSPLVRDAQLRLLKGDAVHGSEVAQKAVASEPFDAEGWLTLAAARLVVGDRAGAAEAYSACIAQAQTIGVTDCRVLAGGMAR